MKSCYRAETLMVVLIALSLFAILFLSYSQWQHQQNKQVALLFQEQQALQIAENQIALKMAAQACEKQLEQNQIVFQIDCNDKQIRVRFPMGEIRVE